MTDNHTNCPFCKRIMKTDVQEMLGRRYQYHTCTNEACDFYTTTLGADEWQQLTEDDIRADSYRSSIRVMKERQQRYKAQMAVAS